MAHWWGARDLGRNRLGLWSYQAAMELHILIIVLILCIVGTYSRFLTLVSYENVGLFGDESG
jgi:hypothetical protein